MIFQTRTVSPDASLFSSVSSAGVEPTVVEKLRTLTPFTDRQHHARTGACVQKSVLIPGVRGVGTRVRRGSRDTVSPMFLGKTDRREPLLRSKTVGSPRDARRCKAFPRGHSSECRGSHERHPTLRLATDIGHCGQAPSENPTLFPQIRLRPAPGADQQPTANTIPTRVRQSRRTGKAVIPHEDMPSMAVALAKCTSIV